MFVVCCALIALSKMMTERAQQRLQIFYALVVTALAAGSDRTSDRRLAQAHPHTNL
jgi:hypothetical protein